SCHRWAPPSAPQDSRGGGVRRVPRLPRRADKPHDTRFPARQRSVKISQELCLAHADRPESCLRPAAAARASQDRGGDTVALWCWKSRELGPAASSGDGEITPARAAGREVWTFS